MLEKTNNLGSDQIQHKPSCTVTEDGFGFRKYTEELYYPCGENKSADQLCSYCTAASHLCFHNMTQFVGFAVMKCIVSLCISGFPLNFEIEGTLD